LPQLPFNAHERPYLLLLQPIMVVESVGEFPTAPLVPLLKLAKRLADAKRGLFIFVFSPSNKLGAIGGLSALPRAAVLNVGDLSR
jgi:hypothetical protein